MNIVLISAFRDMSNGGRIDRYFKQVRSLRDHAGPSHHVRVIAVEGDSTDNTYRDLARQALLDDDLPVQIVKCNHGQRVFSSTEDEDRLRALTGVMIAGMSAVNEYDHLVLYIESDLVWTPHQVGSVIDIVTRGDGGFDIVAPMVFAGNHFYDIWAFRKEGKRFSPYAPYHPSLNGSSLVEVDSAGSCLVFRAGLAREVRPTGHHGLVSWCNGARKQGYRIGVATNFRVDHP